MRRKDEMPPFNHSSSGIRLLLTPPAIYLWHSMGGGEIFLFKPCIKYWCSLQYNTMLTPLSGQSTGKNQKQGHGKKFENACAKCALISAR